MPPTTHYPHTGRHSVAVAPGQVGFYSWLYPHLDGLVAPVARKYRASVWMRTASGAVPSGRLFVRAGTNAQPNSPPSSSVSEKLSPSLMATHPDKAGAWYLVSFTFTLPAVSPTQPERSQLFIGCDNPAGAAETVYFDDFRFQPVDAPMTAFVYDPHTHQRTYSLDNDNLYTRVEYDGAGQVKRTYREVLDAPERPGGERILSEREINYRRWKQPTWVRTGGYRRVTPAIPTLVYWEEKDVNSTSPSYNTVRFNSVSSACSWCQ